MTTINRTFHFPSLNLLNFSTMKPFFSCLLSLAILSGGACPAKAETLSYKDLVRRLTDLEHLAVTPPAGEKGAEASSYDRHSRYDAAADKYIDWGANGDGNGGGLLPKIGDKTLMADIKGPGCIWRTWSATADKGHVKIYLDGSETPVVDLPFTGYFDRTNEPFTRPAIVYRTTANGLDNFTPIPFQKSCRIVADPGWGNYFHFNYTVFPEGTTVPTFKLPLSAEDLAALDEANKTLSQCGQDPAGARDGQATDTKEVTIPAGQTSTVIELSGPNAITGLKVKSDWPKEVQEQRMLLAQLAVSITWDDEKAPAVWAPLGDFFAASAGAQPFQTLPTGLLDDGTFYNYWYMPFGTKARIEVENGSGQPVTLTWNVTHAPLTKPLDTLGRFHAKWHRDAFLPTRADRAPDWTLLTTQGAGRYVGTQLHVWNPLGGWWGEGDEKFFVDGEKFPSSFGTGSEDYFGFAWSSSHTFIQALHSQAVNEGNSGHVSVNRWHIADNIPFETSFEGNIEKYFTNKRGTLYAAVAFWYLNAGGTDPYQHVPVSDRAGWWADMHVYREPGAIEGESLRPIVPALHRAGGQEMWSYEMNVWSDNKQLFWNPREAGESFETDLPAQKPGKYHLLARLTEGPDYGIVQLSLDGQKLGEPVDLYADKITARAPLDLGVVDLSDAKPRIKVEATGKNAASHGFAFGVDYFKLTPVQ